MTLPLLLLFEFLAHQRVGASGLSHVGYAMKPGYRSTAHCHENAQHHMQSLSGPFLNPRRISPARNFP